MNIIEFIESPKLLNDQSLSAAQKMALKAVYGLPMTTEEEAIFKETTGRSLYVPGIEQTEVTFILGRRSGKSDKLASTIAIYESCARQHRFSIGEIPTVMIVASEKERQAKICHNYVLQKLERSKILNKMIRNVKADEIQLTNDVVIQIFPCSQARIRGRSLLCFVGDETAHWKVEGVNVDKQVLDAARPGLSFPHSKCVKISTPWQKRGEVWTDYRLFFGKSNAPVLVFQGSTETFNPSFPKAKLEAARLRDPLVYDSEYLANFQAGLTNYLDPALLESAIIPHRSQLPPLPDIKYSSAVDASSGTIGGDSFAAAIGHRDPETNRIILDVIYEKCAPFNPTDTVKEVCELFKLYRIQSTVGDRYAANFCQSAFETNGIMYEASPLSATDGYVEALPLFTAGVLELLDHKTLSNQLVSLERRTRAQGRDLIDNFFGRDDVSNAVCLLLASIVRGQVLRDDLTRIWSSIRPRPALSDIEQSEKEFLDELAGRRLTEEEKKERALEDEIRKEDEEIEKELGLENRSFGIVRRGWK